MIYKDKLSQSEERILSKPYNNKKYHLKKMYDEVKEDIFDMSNVIFFKEIEKKKMGDVYTLLFLL